MINNPTMEAAAANNFAGVLPSFCNFDRLFDAAKKNTVIQLRWPLVILSSYFLLYSPGEWLSVSQAQAIVVFYLLTNVTLYFIAEDYFNSPYFYGPLLLFDTVFLAVVLGLSGGTTPDLYIACFFTLVLSCICSDSRGLLVLTFLAPLVYGYVVLTGTVMDDPSIYLRLPLPLVISIFYGYFAQVERSRRVASEKEEQAGKERKAAEEIKRQRERLEVLHDANSAVIADAGLSKILEVFLEKALAHLPYAAAVVRLRNLETGMLETAAVRGFHSAKVHPAAISFPPVDEVAKRQAPLAIKNLYEEARLQDIGFLRGEGLVGFLGVPVRAKSGALGSFGFFTRWEYDFTAEERDFASTLAAQLAIAIEHARLYETIERQADELRDANRLKDEFLGVASHQLKSPVNVLSRYVNLLVEGTLGKVSPIQENALHTMMRQCKELQAVINGMLQVNCIESNLVKPEFHETNLWEFLYEVKSIYDSPLEKDVQLIWDFPVDLPVLGADRGKLKQILQQVIDNAIKFTDHGSVKVSARCLPGKSVMEFVVADSGSGIRPDELPVIFDKFSRTDGTPAENCSGAGLGLYIAKRLLELLNGTIDVQSRVGEGSTFTIRIPRGKLDAEPEQLAFPIERSPAREMT